jgi:hypothetical protein
MPLHSRDQGDDRWSRKPLLPTFRMEILVSHSTNTANDDVMPANDELNRLATQFLQACVTRDVEYVAAHAVDEPAGSFTGITTGSDPDWSLSNTINHLQGLKQAGWVELDPHGFVAGEFAWFTAFAYGVIPNGERLGIRTTLIMRRFDGNWKAVHFHVSEAVDRLGIAKE